jgi:hypothetical protein
MATAVQNKNVVSSWGKLLYGAAGEADKFFDLVVKNLEGAAVSGISWGFDEIGAKKKMFGGAKGEIRKSLTINSEKTSLTHRVGAEDFGNCLSISRYLTARDIKYLPDTDFMDIFQVEELVVYNTVAQNAVVDAVRDLMNELGQDSSALDTSSKGFLDVW